MLRKSLSYVEDLLERGHARQLADDLRFGVQLLTKAITQEHDSLAMAAGSGFDTAWHTIQSGYAGPLTWQLKSHAH